MNKEATDIKYFKQNSIVNARPTQSLSPSARRLQVRGVYARILAITTFKNETRHCHCHQHVLYYCSQEILTYLFKM